MQQPLGRRCDRHLIDAVNDKDRASASKAL